MEEMDFIEIVPSHASRTPIHSGICFPSNNDQSSDSGYSSHFTTPHLCLRHPNPHSTPIWKILEPNTTPLTWQSTPSHSPKPVATTIDSQYPHMPPSEPINESMCNCFSSRNKLLSTVQEFRSPFTPSYSDSCLFSESEEPVFSEEFKDSSEQVDQTSEKVFRYSCPHAKQQSNECRIKIQQTIHDQIDVTSGQISHNNTHTHLHNVLENSQLQDKYRKSLNGQMHYIPISFPLYEGESSTTNLQSDSDSKRNKSFSSPSSRPTYCGRFHIDFLDHLQGYPHLIKVLFAFLNPDDLARVCMVNRTWRHACQLDPDTNRRWQEYLSIKKGELKDVGKENWPKKSTPEEPSLEWQSRLTLGVLTQNLVNEPSGAEGGSHLAPSIPLTRHQMFQQEAARLNANERLGDCPKCRAPCRIVQGQNDGLCVRQSCGFHFCLLCWAVFIPGHKCCTSPSRKRLSKSDAVGSKQCKRALRRL